MDGRGHCHGGGPGAGGLGGGWRWDGHLREVVACEESNGEDRLYVECECWP